MSVAGLFRYPVKGLSAEPLARISVSRAGGLAGDRAIAFARRPDVFGEAGPRPLPKSNFLTLALFPSLARLRTGVEGGVLTMRDRDGGDLRADLRAGSGREEACEFLKSHLARHDGAEVDPVVTTAEGVHFTDVCTSSPSMMRALSVLNLASVRALEAGLGRPVDPARFRANIHLDDEAAWPAWSELDRVGQGVNVGSAGLRIVKRTRRCAATDVHPGTAKRDLAMTQALHSGYGHADMGVYAEIEGDGEIAIGDAAVLAP